MSGEVAEQGGGEGGGDSSYFSYDCVAVLCAAVGQRSGEIKIVKKLKLRTFSDRVDFDMRSIYNSGIWSKRTRRSILLLILQRNGRLLCLRGIKHNR